MQLNCETYQSTDELPLHEWETVCRAEGGPFMDLCFLKALEEAFNEEARFWFLLIRDEQQRVVAACCCSLYELDACLLAGPPLTRVVAAIRRIVPRALRLKVVFVGMPFSAGQSHLCVVPGVETESVVEVLEQEVEQLARKNRAPIVVYKEFGESQFAQLRCLEEHGYTAADSSASNVITVDFGSWDDYLSGMRDKYRRKITSSQRRFAQHDFRVEHFDGTAGIDQLYSNKVHDLYLAVLAHSDTALEKLPAETVRRLAAHFGKDSRFTLIYSDETPVAFAFGVYHGEAYYPLLGGFDYQWNRKAELYFNLVYELFREVFRRPIRTIQFGASADEFKARMGAVQSPRYVFVRVRGILKWPFRWFRSAMLPEVQLQKPYRVFKQPKREVEKTMDTLTELPVTALND